MRKILLLTFIGGLGCSPQIFSALNSVAHTIGSAYISSEDQCTSMANAETIPYKQSLFFALFTRFNATDKISINSLAVTSIRDQKVWGAQDALIPFARLTGSIDAFIPRDISTHTSFHFNRLVNRKRILLSG